jgi:ATP-dependent helicase HrpB
VLALAAWGERDPARFGWFEAPSAAAIATAQALLRRLDALDAAGTLTPHGRAMASLPLHPRLARLMIEGRRSGQTSTAAAAAALLSERDPLAAAGVSRAGGVAVDIDIRSQIEFIERSRGGSGLQRGAIDAVRLAHVIATRDQLERQTDRLAGVAAWTGRSRAEGHAADEALARALLAAFPDRLARRLPSDRSRGVMVGGRGVRLPAPSSLGEAELFVALELAESGPDEPGVRRACPVEREWLDPERLQTVVDLEFDPGHARVVAWRRTRWEDLVLESVPLPPPLDAAAELLAREAAVRLDPLELVDDEGRAYLVRVMSLASWMPELGLPVLDATTLRELLPEMCRGCRSFDELRTVRWGDALRARLPPGLSAQVERHAPSALVVPSGRRVQLSYEPGRPPLLAGRIQEFFGLTDTPRIAAGRVAVILQLLAPSDRPQQVTDDLAGFWRRTYPQVRRELHRRYPRHAWPEDPLSALPQSRPSPRRPAPR